MFITTEHENLKKEFEILENEIAKCNSLSEIISDEGTILYLEKLINDTRKFIDPNDPPELDPPKGKGKPKPTDDKPDFSFYEAKIDFESISKLSVKDSIGKVLSIGKNLDIN